MKRLIFLTALITVFTVNLFVTWPLAAQEKPKPGGIFRYCNEIDVSTLDPAQVQFDNELFIVSNVFNSLVNYVPGKWDVYPDLAEKYEVSANHLVYTFFLRKGVKFHNGREMTADDVVYSLKRAGEKRFINNERHNSRDKIEALDKYTVRITLKLVDNIFLEKMASTVGSAIVPKEVVEKYGKAFATSKESTCGTGPYTIKEWNPGRALILEANPNYFRGRPYIDGIERQYIPSFSTQLLNFEAGNMDMVSLKAPYDSKYLKDPKWRLLIDSTVTPGLYWYAIDTAKQPFDNIKLRKALAYGLDRENAIKVAGGGLGIAAYGLISPGLEGYDPNRKYYAYNPELAKTLLKEAGYPKGITIKVITDTYPPSKKFTEYYAAQLAELGINLKMETVESGTARAERAKGTYSFFVTAKGQMLPGMAEYLYENFHSDNAGPAGNFTRYKNEKVDRLISLALKETNKEKRITYIVEAEKEIMEDCPWLLSNRSQRAYMFQPWVHGFVGRFFKESGRWAQINLGDNEMWIDAAKQKSK